MSMLSDDNAIKLEIIKKIFVKSSSVWKLTSTLLITLGLKISKGYFELNENENT